MGEGEGNEVGVWGSLRYLGQDKLRGPSTPLSDSASSLLFFNPTPLNSVVLIDVIAFLVFFLGTPSPISKMRVGFKESGGGERSTVCVWGQGEVNREMDVGEVSAFPGPCPQTPRLGSGQSRGDLMAQAPHSPCNLLHSHPSPPIHHQMPLCRSVLTKSLGYFTLIL